jgi:hypothetical protein
MLLGDNTKGGICRRFVRIQLSKFIFINIKMDKEKLLQLVHDKIEELRKQIEKRMEVIRRTTYQVDFKIDPWRFDEYHYRKEIQHRLHSPIDNDKYLQKYKRKITCLMSYSIFIKDHCNEHNVKYFGLPKE